MTQKKKEAIQAARDAHREVGKILMSADPQTDPASFRDNLQRYVRVTDDLIGHILGEDDTE